MRKNVNVLFRQTAMPIGKTVKLKSMKCCDVASLTAALLFTTAKRSLRVLRFNGKLKTARISCNGTQATKCS